MPVDLTKSLVIGVSSRALFSLEEENRIFDEQGIDRYIEYQLSHEDTLLKRGIAFPLIHALLNLNSKIEDAPHKLVEVILMSKNNPDISLRIYSSISHYGLDITKGAFTSGVSLAPYLDAFSVDLFLSANDRDVQEAVNAGFAAAKILSTSEDYADSISQIRIALDCDAVVFSDASERIYKNEGLEAFLIHEKLNAQNPLPEGPFAKFLKKLSIIINAPSFDPELMRIALVTARNSPAHERVIRTLRSWRVRVHEAFFMGGVEKTKILQAFSPHMFFDDQLSHLQPAAKYVPSAQVPYKESKEADT